MDPLITIPVEDPSRVAEARRRAAAMAQAIGLDETAVARVAIAVTELATNILRHAGRGTMLLQAARTGGLEVLALDTGPGMADVDQCLRDGYSTAGTQGSGLGAVQRQASRVEIYSRPGLGTVILARFQPAAGAGAAATAPLAVGGISVAKPGEEACGDAWQAVEMPDGLAVMVADGLGHGPLAATASREAVRTFVRHAGEPVPAILGAIHAALRATRGAAISVARLGGGNDRLMFGGIGNVAGAVVHGPLTRKTVAHNGTAGLTAPRLQEFTYEFRSGGLLVMHSDGLSSGWSLDRYPGIARHDPSLIAALLYRDFARHRDDATVLVVRRDA